MASLQVHPLLVESNAQELAAAAAGLAADLRPQDFVGAQVVDGLAEFAGKYVATPSDRDITARLADKAAAFIVVFTNQAANSLQGNDDIKSLLLRAAQVLLVRRLTPPLRDHKTKVKIPCRLGPRSFADAAAFLAAELYGTDLGCIANAFSYHTDKYVGSLDDVEAKMSLALATTVLYDMATGTLQGEAIYDIALVTELVVNCPRRRARFEGIVSFLHRTSFVRELFGHGAPAKSGDKKNHLAEINNLLKRALEFA